LFSGTVEELWRYPVKSMRGERVDALRMDGRGAGGDRTYAVWKGDRQLTARETPRLLTFAATYDGADVDPAEPPEARITSPDGLRVADIGELRRDVRGQQDLADSLLLTTDASLRALAGELPEPIDLRRFRTNLHLALDAEPWAELGWEGGRVAFEGGVVLSLLHPCERCVIPTRNPETGAKWPGLLRHLAREHGTQFGINARVQVPGQVVAGERVSVLAP
jgi:uncharacterized protein YcbX